MLGSLTLGAGCLAADDRAAPGAASLAQTSAAPTSVTRLAPAASGAPAAQRLAPPGGIVLDSTPPLAVRTLEIGDADGGVEDDRALPLPPHPEGNDLTAPCHGNADCNFGACYVPGPGPEANPICSKRCDADADCPEGARCAAPLDCTGGESECPGRGYCFRACTRDAECTAWNPIDVGSEPGAELRNPVACVAWVDIHDEPEQPAGPPIDLCIQASEP